MKHWVVLTIFLSVIFIPIKNETGLCEPVKGYTSYIQLLPGGKEKQQSNFSLIDKAKEEVRSQELEKKKRDVKLEKPLDIYTLNSKYIMISFEVFFRPIESSRFSTNPAIYGLLFEGNGKDGLSRYTSRYVKWIGKSDMDDYRAGSVKDFCGYFRRAGVDDCLPDAESDKSSQNQRVVKEKVIVREGKISADQISSGRLKAEYIDASIARKKDVEKALESSTEKIEKMRSELTTQGDALKSLSHDIQAFESKINEQSQKESENKKKFDQLALLENRLKLMEENMNKQLDLTKQLDTRINALTTLFEGVSRNRNTIVISGANLQIVNGTGTTQGEENGSGNLIIGYNEKKPGESLLLGSHELIYPRNDVSESIQTSPNIPLRQEEKKEGFFSSKCFIETAFD